MRTHYTYNDLTGQKFNRLTVLERAEDHIQKGGAHVIMWKCRCDCGNIKNVDTSSLKTGNTKSCGCLYREMMENKEVKHGMSDTKLYAVWNGMISRCNRPKSKHYQYYGGRGIKICEEWQGKDGFIGFRNWAIPAGYKEGLTLDRIDTDGNYEPSNCRWVDMKTQLNNTRRNHILEYKGESHTIAEWSEILHMDANLIVSRIDKLGWDTERALSEQPPKKIDPERRDGWKKFYRYHVLRKQRGKITEEEFQKLMQEKRKEYEIN